jgi:hypothetical protein
MAKSLDAKAKKYQSETKKGGFSVKHGFSKVGFVLDDLGPHQVAYSILRRVSSYLNNSFGVSVVIFIENSVAPCLLKNNVPVFNARELRGYDGHLVATSARSAGLVSEAWRPLTRNWYISGLDPVTKASPHLKDPRISKILATSDFLSEIQPEPYSANIVPSFNLHQIFKTIGAINV